ncbi:MAG: hypothetical protein RL557_888 [archaeon]|jgi:hypothetical protein
MTKDKGRVVKCEGRFHELREYIYSQVFPAVLEDRTIVAKKDLEEMWYISGEDMVSTTYDWKDPYFFCRPREGRITDPLRENPHMNALSLVPLVESPYHLTEGLVTDYALSMNNNAQIAGKLEKMAQHPERFLQVLGKEPGRIIIQKENGSGTTNLKGYKIGAHFGIGTIVSGGVLGGGIRSDSPFLIEIYKEHPEHRGEDNLVAVVGFWAQNNEMLVSQMQSCRNAQFPEGVKFGMACMRIAEEVAERMGFEKILTYSAREHPMFKQHPGSRGQLIEEFTCIWDSSLKKLKYDGSRNSDGYQKETARTHNGHK